MDEKLTPLFTPWKIRDLEIKNRFVMTSMGGTSLFGWMEVNHFDKEAAKFLLDKAEHDVGLILPGIQPVYNPMLGQWLYKKKGMHKKLKPFMEEIHKHGAKMFIQLTAGFGRSFTISPAMEKLYTNRFLRLLSKPIMNFDKICASSSPSPNRWSDKVPSREMTIKEIHKFVMAFAKTAKLLKDAGVDGVEIHAVHEGYLLDQFTLQYVNKRTDEYGGSFENRYRFPVEIVKAIKDSVKDFSFQVEETFPSANSITFGMGEVTVKENGEAKVLYVEAATTGNLNKRMEPKTFKKNVKELHFGENAKY